MELDGRLGGAKVRPRKDRQAQVDGGGVESVDRIVEIKSQFLVGMEGRAIPIKDWAKSA